MREIKLPVSNKRNYWKTNLTLYMPSTSFVSSSVSMARDFQKTNRDKLRVTRGTSSEINNIYTRTKFDFITFNTKFTFQYTVCPLFAFVRQLNHLSKQTHFRRHLKQKKTFISRLQTKEVPISIFFNIIHFKFF